MAHIADHQLVALLELAALDGAGEQIASGGEERDVLRVEMPLFHGADAEDAIGAAVAAGDGHVHAARAGVVLHVARHLEPAFAGKFVDDHRDGGIQSEARVAVRFADRQNRADDVTLPAEAGAQQQLAIARQQFEDFDEVDRKRQRDGAHRIVEQPLQIGLDERALAELRQRFLLLGAAAQLIFEIGDVFRMFERHLRGNLFRSRFFRTCFYQACPCLHTFTPRPMPEDRDWLQ